MMHSKTVSFLLKIFTVSLIGTSLLCAQIITEEVPPEYEDPVEDWVKETERKTSPFYKQRFSDNNYAGKMLQGQIVAIANEMISQFDDVDWGENETQQQRILNHLEGFLNALKIAQNAPGIEGAIDDKTEQNIFLETLNSGGFGLHSLQIESLDDAGGAEVSGYFVETENQLTLYEYSEVGGEEKVRLLLTPSQVREWRLLENALGYLLTEQVNLVADANIHLLRNAVVRWENFLDKGYSQMPWESLINGWLFKPSAFPEPGPPRQQLLFMHPTLGLELSVDPIDESRVKEVMHIELLGYLWYRGAQLKDYSGFSLAASLREDLDPGIGVMFHIKRNWSIGLTWHDVEEDPFVFFSVDLFSFAKQNATRYVEQYNAVKKRLELTE